MTYHRDCDKTLDECTYRMLAQAKRADVAEAENVALRADLERKDAALRAIISEVHDFDQLGPAQDHRFAYIEERLSAALAPAAADHPAAAPGTGLLGLWCSTGYHPHPEGTICYPAAPASPEGEKP